MAYLNLTAHLLASLSHPLPVATSPRASTSRSAVHDSQSPLFHRPGPGTSFMWANWGASKASGEGTSPFNQLSPLVLSDFLTAL